MDDIFDPYHKWLGIPPAEQPPDHYRLLGLALFESDPAVIESAADRQMTHVRTFQTGRHADKSQDLLNKIAAARLCLLKQDRKAGYDRTLRVQQEARKAASSPPAPVRATAAPPVAKAALTSPLPISVEPAIPSFSIEPLRRALPRSRKQIPLVPIGLGIAVGLIVLIFMMNRAVEPSPEPSVVENLPGSPTNPDSLAVVEDTRLSEKPDASSQNPVPQIEPTEEAVIIDTSESSQGMPPDQGESMPSESTEGDDPPPTTTTTSDSDDDDAAMSDDNSDEEDPAEESDEEESPDPKQSPTKPGTPKRPRHIPKEAIFWNGSWYLFSEKKASFDESFAMARRLKGRLLVIKSSEENTFVTSHLRGPTWLGLKKQSGGWINVLGKGQRFFAWQPGQPQSGKGEIFVAIHPNGQWHDYLPDKLYFCVEWGTD